MTQFSSNCDWFSLTQQSIDLPPKAAPASELASPSSSLLSSCSKMSLCVSRFIAKLIIIFRRRTHTYSQAHTFERTCYIRTNHVYAYINTHTHVHTHTHTHTRTHTRTDRQREAYRQIDRVTDRQTDGHKST